MNKKLPLMIVILITLVIFISGFFLFQKSRQTEIFIPFFDKSPVQKLAAVLENSSLKLETVPVVVDEKLIASISGYSIIFSYQKDLETQVRSLQLILPRLKMENKTVKEIDLRFNKVIIRY